MGALAAGGSVYRIQAFLTGVAGLDVVFFLVLSPKPGKS